MSHTWEAECRGKTGLDSFWIQLLTVPGLSFIAIGSIMNSAWITDHGVTYGTLCTAQGRRV